MIIHLIILREIKSIATLKDEEERGQNRKKEEKKEKWERILKDKTYMIAGAYL